MKYRVIRLRRPWHTHVAWCNGYGVIAVNGGFTDATHRRRLENARKLARWAWGTRPGEPAPALETDARERGAALRPFREAG